MAVRRKAQVMVGGGGELARPVDGPVDIKAMHDAVSKRFRKVLAELGR